MSIFAIGDLHLPGHELKPMTVFGGHWERHFDTIRTHWLEMITPDDVVLIPGDISWAMQLSEAMDDLNAIAQLPGEKLLLRGNHDYWWSSLNKVRSVLKPGMHVIQNDALLLNGQVFCGTRGWMLPMPQQPLQPSDHKIYQRELMRLRMSLEHAVSLSEEKKAVVMMHYPPLLSDGAETAFTKLLEAYPVACVVYGHLHGSGIKIGFEGERNGIRYHLVSCDALDFCPLRIVGGENEI